MKLTETEVREEFITHFVELREVLLNEGEPVDKQVEWQAFLVRKINAQLLRPEAIHWVCPRIPATLNPD